MGEDEADTLAALRQLRTTLFGPTATSYNGVIIKDMGGGAGQGCQGRIGRPRERRLAELEKHRLVTIRVTEVATVEHVRDALPRVTFVAAAEFERLCV